MEFFLLSLPLNFYKSAFYSCLFETSHWLAFQGSFFAKSNDVPGKRTRASPLALRPKVQSLIPFRIPALSKAAKVRPAKQEVEMRLITKFELATKTKNELYALQRKVFNELARSAPDSHERRNALASVENIQCEINSRHPSI